MNQNRIKFIMSIIIFKIVEIFDKAAQYIIWFITSHLLNILTNYIPIKCNLLWAISNKSKLLSPLQNSICDILKWTPNPSTTPVLLHNTSWPHPGKERQNVMINLFRGEKKNNLHTNLLSLSDLIPRRKWQVEKRKKKC